MIHTRDADFTFHVGDALQVLCTLVDESVDCCVTSPPYWGLRDYGIEGQLGLEATPDLYVSRLVDVFREVRRVLVTHGTCWINLGDSFEEKQLQGIPWHVAFALQADGWYLRSDIVWSKPNPMPESVTDRPTKAHEYVFLLTKQPRYFFDQEAVREPSIYPDDNRKARQKQADYTERAVEDRVSTMNPQNARTYSTRNIRSVWEIATQPYREAHFATFPEELVRRCILAGCPEGGVVLDPFIGSGTTALVARKAGRSTIGIELSPKYAEIAARRLSQQSLFA